MASVIGQSSISHPASETPAHHVGNPPTSFQNPWPSFRKQTGWDTLSTRFGRDRNFVPVPPREELVQIRTPDWGAGKQGLKVTWIGHATFLAETTVVGGAERGVRLLLDPVWSERTSPVKWAGPKRSVIFTQNSIRSTSFKLIQTAEALGG